MSWFSQISKSRWTEIVWVLIRFLDALHPRPLLCMWFYAQYIEVPMVCKWSQRQRWIYHNVINSYLYSIGILQFCNHKAKVKLALVISICFYHLFLPITTYFFWESPEHMTKSISASTVPDKTSKKVIYHGVGYSQARIADVINTITGTFWSSLVGYLVKFLMMSRHVRPVIFDLLSLW